MKKRDLTKKVLCTVLAASVFGVCGNVSADEPYVVDSNKEITGVELTGQDVIVPGNFHESGYDLTVTGKYTIGNLEISGESAVNLNVAGNITNGIYMHSGDDLSLIAKDANIEGYINITGGAAKLTGGKIITGDIYEKEEGIYLQEDIRVNEQSYLSLDGVEVNGNIMAEGKDSEINIKNSTVNEGVFYAAEPIDGRYQLVMDENGKPIVEGYTELQAEVGGIVTVENSVLNTSLSAYGEGSKMTVTNSSVKTKGGVLAAEGGKIYLNGNADTVYEVAKDGYFMAASTNQADTTTKIEINGGTLKIENLRYLTGVGPDENGNTNPCLDESYQGEEQTFYAVKGGIVLKGEGVIETKGDQIFEHGVDVSSDEAVLNSTSGAVTNDAISYEGGTLRLTDEKYSLNYVATAKKALDALKYDSTTSIVMTGDLVTNGEINEITVGEAASVGDEIALDKVTVKAGKNLLVGSETADVVAGGVTAEDKVGNGFSAGKLNLAKDSNGMIITNAKNVTLGGSEGGQLIFVADSVVADASKLKVVVGTTSAVAGVTDKTGSFTIGNSLATSNTKYTLTGSVTVNEGSALNVNGQTTVTGGVELNSGAVNVGNGTLNTNITANGTSTITGAAQVGTLTGAAGAVINVGNTDKAGNVTVTNVELKGATVFLDPAWKDGAEITDASKMAVAGKDGNVTIDGNYVVGQNSVMSFGVDNNEKAQETFAKTGLTWGEAAITAGLYINGSVDLNGKAIVVDGNLTDVKNAVTDAGTFTAAANSVVMVDGQSIKDTAAITGITDETKVTIADTSKLYIDGAKKGDIYHVIDGVTTKGWSDENIISNNALLIFAGENADSKFDVTASYDKVANVYGAGAVEIANVVDATLAAKDEGDAAFDFFNAAANSNNNLTKDAQIAAFNSAANMGELAGVNHGTYSMSNAMTDAVTHHLSLATHGEQDKDIWAHYIHNKEDIDGMDLGGIEGSYDAQYNGIVVGSDLYKNGKVTAGVALSYADGNIDGSNIAATTKNDAEYYGASLYGRIDNGNSAILGDISYLHSDNDITQNNSGQEITASADADAFSIGIRAEQAYEAGAGKFVPYAGIRYMHLGAGNYDNSLGMSYDADDQNLWLLPVGVTYSAEVQSGDWTVKPVAEVGYVWTMGDRDTDQTVSLNGASDTFGFETADSGSFIGRLGIEAEKADVTYGLSYEYQKGDTVKANKWMANLTWSF